MDAGAQQLFHAVLRRLRLKLLGGANIGEQRHVQVQNVIASDFFAQLANGFEERLAFDVAYRSADLTDDDVGSARGRQRADALLDLIGDVGDDLNRAAQILTAPLFADHRGVDLPGCDIACLAGGLVGEALVVAEVQVGFGAVIRDEDFAVLIRRHCAGVNIDVGVELHDGDRYPTALEQTPHRGDGNALSDGRGHTASDE